MRLLLAIGCDQYDHVGCLRGAELDARRIYETLTSPKTGAYDIERSRLILSPTSESVRSIMREALFVESPIDELTFYFAGHGCLGPGSFYMATRDTRLEALSMTAVSLGDILRAIAEIKPVHTNIIIDACESGGLIEDLNVILKGSLIGGASSPGITLFAASASNEYAAESATGGLATNSVLDCITGGIPVRDDVPTLELVEIGRVVGTRLSDAHQTPIVWGLNLHGPSRFCSNPHYAQADVDLRLALTRRIDSATPIPQDISAALWRMYYATPEKWSCTTYISTLSDALAHMEAYPERLSDLAYRFCISTLSRSTPSQEVLLPIKIYASTLCAILPWMHHRDVRSLCTLLADRMIEQCSGANKQLLSDLEADPHALLNGGGGLPDLFYLPIRAMDTLAWLSLALYSKDPASTAPPGSQEWLLLCRRVLDIYPGAFTAISEAQAPQLAAIILGTEACGARELSDEILGYLMRSTIECGGMFAPPDANGKSAFTYLLARDENNLSEQHDLFANPSELLATIIRLANLTNLDEVFDPLLWNLDDRSCIAFVGDCLSTFGLSTVPSGTNKIWTIGRNLFRVSDIGRDWPGSSTAPADELERICILCCCLLHQDRVPWQLIQAMDSANIA